LLFLLIRLHSESSGKHCNEKLQSLPDGALLLTVSQGASLPAARNYFLLRVFHPQTPGCFILLTDTHRQPHSRISINKIKLAPTSRKNITGKCKILAMEILREEKIYILS
jgi:hypothetical protein